MDTTMPDDAADDGGRKLPPKVQQILDGVKDGSISGITAQEFIQVFQAIAGSYEAVKRIADMAAESQKGAHDSIKSAIKGDSESLSHIAQNLETDQARLEFTRLYLEREREKTRQAKTAAKANDSNNKLWATLATIVGGVVLGGIKLLADRRSA